MKSTTAVALSTYAILLLVAQQSALLTASSPLLIPDPEMLEYLDSLFESVKQLGRPLLNGEMNLLPAKDRGFANSVRCFSGEW